MPEHIEFGPLTPIVPASGKKCPVSTRRGHTCRHLPRVDEPRAFVALDHAAPVVDPAAQAARARPPRHRGATTAPNTLVVRCEAMQS